MSKDRERREEEATQRQAEEQRRQAELQQQAAQQAEQRVTQAGQPRAGETARLQRYQEKAAIPGETLMTQVGPISQAVARRVQERVTTPGMDYDPTATMGILGPELWRGLKQRGIAPPPGAEPGLAGQQYMKGALPYLAREREQAVSRDIERGMGYGREARALPQRYEDLEGILAEALRGRQYGAEVAAPEYGVRGAEAYAKGRVGAAQTEAEFRAQRAEQQRETQTAIGKFIGNLVLTGATGAAGATPYSRALQKRAGGRFGTEDYSLRSLYR